jgi:hypothetical protein
MGADTIKIGAEIQFNAEAVAKKYLTAQSVVDMKEAVFIIIIIIIIIIIS